MGSKFLEDMYTNKDFLKQDFYIVWYYCKNGDKCLYIDSSFSNFIFHKSSLGRLKGHFKKRGLKYEIQKVNLKLGEVLTLDK